MRYSKRRRWMPVISLEQFLITCCYYPVSRSRAFVIFKIPEYQFFYVDRKGYNVSVFHKGGTRRSIIVLALSIPDHPTIGRSGWRISLNSENEMDEEIVVALAPVTYTREPNDLFVYHLHALCATENRTRNEKCQKVRPASKPIYSCDLFLFNVHKFNGLLWTPLTPPKAMVWRFCDVASS